MFSSGMDPNGYTQQLPQFGQKTPTKQAGTSPSKRFLMASEAEMKETP